MAGAPHLEAFLIAARYFIGLKESGTNTFKDPRGRELWNLWGWDASGTSWCAIFVSACAKKAGVLNKVIAKDSYAIGVQYYTVERYGGTWIDGPLINGGHAVTPIPGDIITFGDSKYKGHYSAKHVGIVEYVEDDKVHTIEGNASDQCMRKSYALSNSRINAYVRPDWSRVGDDVSSYLANAGQLTIGPLYQDRNDRHDMTLRQVGYLNNKYDLSNNASGIAISVINYTSVLGDLYDMFAPMTISTPQVNTNKLHGNVKIAVDQLLKAGFSASAASGIAGCLKAYSNINPAYRLQEGRSWRYGICLWNSTQLPNVKRRLGDGWSTDLSGQIQYLLDDLDNNYHGIISVIKLQTLDAETAERVAEAFIKLYTSNLPNAYTTNAKIYAADIYNSLVIVQSTVVGNITNLKAKNGNVLSAKKSITIPTSVPQTGIIDDFTSYSTFYHIWARRSPQRQLADMWADQGFPCDKGIATIGGYYCVAVRPKFGACGDVLVVTLEGGKSFSAIICDEKGEDAGSEWGHVKGGGKISLIEWERVKTKNGKVVTENVRGSDVDSRGFGDWYGKKVLSITNYGKYADVRWK